MKKWILVPLLLASFACDDVDNNNDSLTVIWPSRLAAPPAFRNGAFMVEPSFFDLSFLDPLLIPGAVCPHSSPLFVPLSLGFRGDGRSDLFLSGVQMQFVDRTGIAGKSIAFGRTDLVHRFGSLALPASGTRLFPFEFPFGCGGLLPGTVNVFVVAGDSFGHERRSTLHVPIR